MHRFNAQFRQQGGHVRTILRQGVQRFVAQPVAAPAPDHVRTDHPVFVRHGLRQKIEVATAAREAMDADKNLGVPRIAPFHIGHVMESGAAEALHPSFTHLQSVHLQFAGEARHLSFPLSEEEGD
jgi:hypothetical protein